MTIDQFHLEFKIGLDKTDSLNYPDFLPEEIDVFLNKNIERFVSQRLYGTNPKKNGVESNQKRFDDLITLVTGIDLNIFSSPVSGKPNSSLVSLPVDYWHALEEEANISYVDCNNVTVTERVPVYPIMHDKYNKIIRDPFNKPDKAGVLRMGLFGSMELITGNGITLLEYYLRYIRKPAIVTYGSVYATPVPDVQCDLPESVHKEIIEMSVFDALGNIEANKRIQTEANQLNTIE